MIADDHPFYRGRLAKTLREKGLEVVGEVGNGQAAIDAAETEQPDVVLIDLRMPILSGTEAIRRLTERAPLSRILAITAAALEDEVAEAILCGANGHVTKDRPIEELLRAIESVAAGRPVLSTGAALALLRRIRGEEGVGRSLASAPLVGRELEILELLAAGRTEADAAAELALSPAAVSERVGAVLTKLRIEDRIQAALQDAEAHPPEQRPYPPPEP